MSFGKAVIKFISKVLRPLAHINPFSKKILQSSTLKEFADNNFELDENGRKFSKWVENIVGKEEIAPNEQCLQRLVLQTPGLVLRKGLTYL